MSKIHILSAGNWDYSVILHTSTPGGSNSAGKSWSDILVAMGMQTSMIVGTGPGQITQAEANSIAAGDTIEIVASILVESGGATQESLDEMADKIIQVEKQKLQMQYKYYGYTQG